MPYNPIFGGGVYTSASPSLRNDSSMPSTSQPLSTPGPNRAQQEVEAARSLLSGRRGSLPDDLSTLDLLQPHVSSLFNTKLRQHQQQQQQQHQQQILSHQLQQQQQQQHQQDQRFQQQQSAEFFPNQQSQQQQNQNQQTQPNLHLQHHQPPYSHQIQPQQLSQQLNPRSSSVGRNAISIPMSRPNPGFFARTFSSPCPSPPSIPMPGCSRSAGFSFPGDFSFSPSGAGGSSGGRDTLSQTLGRGSGWRGGEEAVYGELTTQLADLISAHTADYQQGLAQAVSDKLQDLQISTEELFKKEAECQNLKKVMRDLAITRAEAITLKVQLSESYNRLHQEYCRVMRSAQLAQAAAKCSTIKVSDLRKELVDTQDKLLHQKKQVRAHTRVCSGRRAASLCVTHTPT
ncbi:MAG: hypothetical protein WDW38_001775 [Sanguina aurantia]